MSKPAVIKSLEEKRDSAFDVESESSLYFLAPESIKKVIRSLEEDNNLYNSEDEVLDHLREMKQKPPSVLDSRLRANFWLEYDDSMRFKRKISTSRICRGVCSKSYFLQTYLKYKHKTMWLLCPPREYTELIIEALNFGTVRMREILALPHETYDRKGNVVIDTKLIDIQRRIWEMFANRIMGGVLEKKVQMNLDSRTNQDIPKTIEVNNMEEINEELKKLDEKENVDEQITKIR